MEKGFFKLGFGGSQISAEYLSETSQLVPVAMSIRESIVNFFEPPKATCYHSDVEVEKELKKVKNGLLKTMTDPFAVERAKCGRNSGSIVDFTSVQTSYIQRFNIVFQKMKIGDANFVEEEEEEHIEELQEKDEEEDIIEFF